VAYPDQLLRLRHREPWAAGADHRLVPRQVRGAQVLLQRLPALLHVLHVHLLLPLHQVMTRGQFLKGGLGRYLCSLSLGRKCLEGSFLN
jgi:hypothetical protein